MIVRALLGRLREIVITGLADQWAARQRAREEQRELDQDDASDLLSPESFSFWMRKQQREDARNNAGG